MHTMKDINGHYAPWQREERWKRSNPLELGKEIAQMERARVQPFIIAHAVSFKASMEADYQSRYGCHHGGL